MPNGLSVDLHNLADYFMKLQSKIIVALIPVLLVVVYLLNQNNQNNMTNNNQGDNLIPPSQSQPIVKPISSPTDKPATVSDGDSQSGGDIKQPLDFNLMYRVKDGEVPNNTGKIETGIPGVEVWVIPQSLAQDPVQYHYWLVTAKGKYLMDDRNVIKALTDVSFSPKNENDALIASRLPFHDPTKNIVESANLAKIRGSVPDDIKSSVNVPKIIKEGDYYLVELGVYSHESLRGGGSSDSFAIYNFKVGPSFFQRTSSNLLWMPKFDI